MLGPLPIFLSALLALTTFTTSSPVPSRPRDSSNVPVTQFDLSELEASSSEKYFHEPGGGEVYGHYDSRFYLGNPVDDTTRHRIQHNMIRAYLATMRSLGYTSWLAHGSLLGWWWNGQSLPWDGDFDVQVWDETLYAMAEHHNMTTHTFAHFEITPEGEVEELTSIYLLDINPNHVSRTRGNWLNVIDARWIDTATGLFIDITALSETSRGLFSCKNYHAYKRDDIEPLQETVFEGMRALVPNRYEDVLVTEYTAKSLTSTTHMGHEWDGDEQVWVPETELKQ